MINLIRMNLIRMFKMKCIYILLLVSLLIAFIFVTESQDTSTDEAEQQIMEEQKADGGENGNQVGITVDTSNEDSTICWLIAQFESSGFMVIMVGIFMSILACGEHDSGFLKNLASCSQHKWMVVMARLIPGFLCSIIIQLGLFLSMLGMNALYGCPLKMGDVRQLLIVAAIQTLLHTAFSAFVLTTVEITRSLLISILVSIFTGFGFAGLIVAFVSQNLTNYMILSRIKMTALPLDNTLLPATIAVGGITLIAYTVLSGLIFQKRDTY